ncbi:MAG: hypothetical protein Q4G49_13510 [Paracoccus sp. (in: a-proteobacteria)]|nr:hypothetical protein [Paracoccus sp. (in: a-proteobacteria)]
MRADRNEALAGSISDDATERKVELEARMFEAPKGSIMDWLATILACTDLGLFELDEGRRTAIRADMERFA